jgi:hypothetical protein
MSKDVSDIITSALPYYHLKQLTYYAHQATKGYPTFVFSFPQQQ